MGSVFGRMIFIWFSIKFLLLIRVIRDCGVLIFFSLVLIILKLKCVSV